MSDYYVYVALLDDVPRYVGYGKKRRIDHVNSGISHVRKLNEVVIGDNKQFHLEIPYDGLSRSESIKLENTLIAKYGREDMSEGSLWNQTNGHGFVKGRHSQKTLKLISIASKERWSKMSDEERNDYADKCRSNKQSAKTRFKKGSTPHNKGKLGVNGFWYELKNVITGECYNFRGKIAFFKNNPNFPIVKSIKVGELRTTGKWKNWIMVRTS